MSDQNGQATENKCEKRSREQPVSAAHCKRMVVRKALRFMGGRAIAAEGAVCCCAL